MFDKKQFFREGLYAWAADHPRPLPWKNDPDPYKIWLSEVILQQTRVEQGLPYYLRFVETFPTVQALAAAPDDAVFKLWEGLGYYSRARNLLAAARHVTTALGGQFPDTHLGLLNLQGVGDYTAAAIASFAFGLPHAVVDGNVYRVLARFYGIADPIDAPVSKRRFAALAQEVLDPARPGAWNQAMMDFGATHCTPRLPKCPTCPLRPQCVAFQTGQVEVLPLKGKKAARRDRWFLYVVVNSQGDTFVSKREKKDIWQGLYEFPLLELTRLPDTAEEAAALVNDLLLTPDQNLPAGATLRLSAPYQQALTHQNVAAVFLEVTLPDDLSEHFFKQKVFIENLRFSRESAQKHFAFPRIIERYWQEGARTLRLF